MKPTIFFRIRNNLPILLHIATWLLLFILPTYLIYLNSERDTHMLSHNLVQIACYVTLFYVNYFLLTPRLFFRKNRILYFIATFFLVLLMNLPIELATSGRPPMDDRPPVLGPPYERHPDQRPPRRPYTNLPRYNFFLTSLFISGFALALQYSKKVYEKEKAHEESERERLNTELAFLKNQISPHFFFNTLNNIYSLLHSNIYEGQRAILQLSKLMRYLLYESEQGNTMLSREIEFMKNYIELMRLRLSHKVTLSIVFPEQYTDISIPPLLFIPFIENAFKLSYRDASFINIVMSTDEKELFFSCINSIDRKFEEVKTPDSGIGLENIRKRLSLLYPYRHSLVISNTETTFNVEMRIDLLKDSEG
jgi:two-component system, LytTR family, sensor kinase